MGVLTNVDEIINFKEEVAKIASASAIDPRVDQLVTTVGELGGDVDALELSVEQLSGSILTVQGEVEDKVDNECITDVYDEGKNPATVQAGWRTPVYAVGDQVMYEGRLYACTTAIYAQAGVWNSTYWALVEDFNSESTYREGDLVLYEGTPYQCAVESISPGEWDSSKWNAIPEAFSEYSESAVYEGTMQTIGSKVIYEGNYYFCKYNFNPTGGAGAFVSAYWSEQTVLGIINDKPSVVITDTITVNGTTDENGFLIISDTTTSTIFIAGGTVIKAIPDNLMGNYCEVPYGKAYNMGMLKLRFYDSTGSVLASTALTNFKLKLVYVK